jgi:hypothetical protein
MANTTKRRDVKQMVHLNSQGGTIPATSLDLQRARAADLGTLPDYIEGTNCGNCKFMASRGAPGSGLGMCLHQKVRQPVSVRMCCAFWDATGFQRV